MLKKHDLFNTFHKQVKLLNTFIGPRFRVIWRNKPTQKQTEFVPHAGGAGQKTGNSRAKKSTERQKNTPEGIRTEPVFAVHPWRVGQGVVEMLPGELLN
jgi:hypothetical protein